MFTASLGLDANIQTQSKELRKTRGLKPLRDSETLASQVANSLGKCIKSHMQGTQLKLHSL